MAVATLAVGVAGCNREEPAVTQTDTAAQQTSVQRDDTWIETSVQAKYYGDDAVRGRNITVDANGGAVTLRGTVETEQARQQAVSLARSVDGVTSVNDELQVSTAETARAEPSPVAPGSDTIGTAGREDERTPGWITTKIQAQYFVNPEIKPWNIDVTTNSDGVVTLEGAVEETNDKTEAVRIARETEGVTRVEDRLRLQRDEGETAREADKPAGTGVDAPDAWLTTKIQAKYFTDDEVKGRNINVDTNNGVVTLNGTVGNEAERRQALALARNTDGVQDVTDRLTIDPTAERADRDLAESARGGMQSAERQAERTIAEVERPDAWVTTKVQAKYFMDADVKGHKIDVDTRNGVVTLTGTVENAQQKAEAEQIASETDGVKRVVNQLTVGAKR